MTRTALLALALTACTAPICAGCGTDDGREPPAEYRAGYESLISAEPASCASLADDSLYIHADGTMESLRGGRAPFTLDAGAWVGTLRYPSDFRTWRLEPSEDLSWATAEVSIDGGCTAVARFARID